MISIPHAIILGIIEGLTEFLPISSTGHLIIANYFLGNDLTSSLVQTFEISIQLGAILAVLGTYWRDLLSWPVIRLLIYGFVPTAIIGLSIKGLVGSMLALPIVVAIALIVGGIGIILAELHIAHRSLFTKFVEKIFPKDKITNKEAAILGVWQSLALIPGMSRSGSMIIGGLLLHIQREVLVKYTFLLAVPTMSAATLLSLKDSYHLFNSSNITVLLIGFITSLITAIFAVKWFIPFIKKTTFIPFGIYRIILGAILLLALV